MENENVKSISKEQKHDSECLSICSEGKTGFFEKEEIQSLKTNVDSTEEVKKEDTPEISDSVESGHSFRTLTEEEVSKLEKDVICVSEFKQNKLEKEAQKNWDLFYKRNTTKFFKDRHWTKREFDELCSDESQCGTKKTLLEVGCGVGNFIWPLLEEESSMYIYACDFSPRAVQFVKDNPNYNTDRCCVFQCDITKDDLTTNIPQGAVDIVSMIFVLSAIHPHKMIAALSNIVKVLRPGGSLLLRDYGLYDHAMLRFAPGHKLQENFYVRQDGTRAYYFSTERIMDLMISSGFDSSLSKVEYIKRETVNRKEDLCVPRIFVQGKFVKPRCEQEQVPHCSNKMM